MEDKKTEDTPTSASGSASSSASAIAKPQMVNDIVSQPANSHSEEQALEIKKAPPLENLTPMPIISRTESTKAAIETVDDSSKTSPTAPTTATTATTANSKSEVHPAPSEGANKPLLGPSEAPAVVGVAASQMAKQKHAHRNNKKLAAIMTVLVTIVLAAVAVYVYMTANKNAEKTSNTDSSSVSPTPAETVSDVPPAPATEADIDAATQDIVNEVDALDDDADFNEQQLSDTNLNLQ